MGLFEGFFGAILKFLLVGFILMLITWILLGAPLTPFRLIVVFLKTFSGGGG